MFAIDKVTVMTHHSDFVKLTTLHFHHSLIPASDVYCILQLNLPESVTERWGHSLAIWNMSLTIVRLVQFGGWRDGFINYKLNDSTVIELSK